MQESTKQVLGPNKFEGFREWLQLTWQQLSTFCQDLTDGQKRQTVQVWGDEFHCLIAWHCDGKLLGYRQNMVETPMTWGQLDEFLNPLQNSQLPVEIDCDGKPIEVYYIEELLEDYVDDSEGACQPESMLEEGDEKVIIHPKGTLFLNTGV